MPASLFTKLSCRIDRMSDSSTFPFFLTKTLFATRVMTAIIFLRAFFYLSLLEFIVEISRRITVSELHTISFFLSVTMQVQKDGYRSFLECAV